MEEENFTEQNQLHYSMLKYLYGKQALSSSCFSHCWEDFKLQNNNVELSAERLKTLFWREIIPNISQYPLLSSDQKNYFDQDKIFFDFDDANLSESICQNETRPNGRDYLLCRSTIDYLKPQETIKDVEESFRRPNKCKGVFGFESDAESDEDCVKIRQDKPPVEIECDSIEQNLMMTFNAFLRKPGEATLSADEVRERLKDAKLLSSLDDVNNLSIGVKEFVQKFAFFESTIEPDIPDEFSRESSVASSIISQKSSEKENSMNVPEDSTPWTSTPHGIVARRSLRSNSTLTPTRPKNSAQNVQDGSSAVTVKGRPASQPRMKSWMNDFGGTKRRRLSSSPSTMKNLPKSKDNKKLN